MAMFGRASGWFVLEGLLLLILGVLALVVPVVAGLAAALVFGWILLLSGILGLVAVFTSRGLAHPGWSALSAIIAIIAGLVLLLNPFAGAVSLTLLIGAYFLVDGIALIGLALDQRKRSRRWGWLLASGILDLILAALIVLVTPLTATLLIGLWVGIDLVAAGLALIGIGLSAPRTGDGAAAQRR